MIKKVSYGWINRFTEIQFIARPFYDDDVVLADRKTLDAKMVCSLRTMRYFV